LYTSYFSTVKFGNKFQMKKRIIEDEFLFDCIRLYNKRLFLFVYDFDYYMQSRDALSPFFCTMCLRNVYYNLLYCFESGKKQS
jgi:hypothetical protein